MLGFEGDGNPRRPCDYVHKKASSRDWSARGQATAGAGMISMCWLQKHHSLYHFVDHLDLGLAGEFTK